VSTTLAFPMYPSTKWLTSASISSSASTSTSTAKLKGVTDTRMSCSSSSSSSGNGSEFKIDYQSDTTLYGRGEMHLSAVLEEGDIAVYQTGTWEVDGVEVGDGTPACFEYCVVETIQIVWTHNCEHGFIHGMDVKVTEVDPDSSSGSSSCRVKITSPLKFIDFGPEQLVARLPVKWISDEKAQLLVNLPSALQSF